MSVGVSSQEYNHEPPYSLLHALSASTTKATLPATTPTALEARTAYVGSSSPLFIPQNSTSRARTRSSFCSDSQLPQFGNDETLQQLQLRPQSLYVYFNTPGCMSQIKMWTATLLPILLWLLLFTNCKYIPLEWRPEIHVNLLPALDNFFFSTGIRLSLSAVIAAALGLAWTRSVAMAGYFLLVPLVVALLCQLASVAPNPAMDLLLFLPYGLLHYLSPFVFVGWLYFYGTPGSISLFLKALGWQNIAGVVTQLIFPCAAPWYNDKFGFAPANYTMSGDPAGLVNIDTLLGTHMYTQLFNSSPLVFGAMPSLHSAFACLIMLFVMQTSRRSGYIAIAIFKPSLETPVALSTSNTFSKGLLGGYFSVPAASTLSDSSTPFKTYYPTTKEYAQLPEMATHPHETTAFAVDIE
ncbi:hypothetical protein BSLG_009548 [Batrachochytrium salamandrivorans]|nr:hypothetical protein BSLG_009548 [Batrachochytrium salamandrivorans]